VARSSGVDAYVWLPASDAAAELDAYAARVGAGVVLVSSRDARLADALERPTEVLPA
jgi:hypothetical protein